jgi:two-component system LytT family sensor kinase
MKLLSSLIQTMSVFLVVAYLYCKSPGFKTLTSVVPSVRQKLYFYFFFSVISMMGTYLGLPAHGALANTRAIGPVLAGIIGGPLLGTAVGFTGGLHRYFFGGFTALACGVSTTVEGLIGGLVHVFLVKSNRSGYTFDPKVVLATTTFSEMIQMLIILAVARPYWEALALVKIIALPMIATSSVGAALFVSIIRDRKNMYEKAAAIFSTRAFKIAERTLNILTNGFNRDTAPGIARIIYEETGVGTVAITDRDKVMAFVGYSADHHLPDTPFASDITRKAIAENQVFFSPTASRSASPACFPKGVR